MRKIIILVAVVLLAAACVTQKSRSDVSPIKKFNHDLNSEFNGYFNANELYEAALLTLNEGHSDYYNKLLPVYKYTATDSPDAVSSDMDEAIKKVTVIRALHEPSHWIDDCYLMAGKAQYLKQDYESAEETLSYLVDEFSPEAKLKKSRKKKKSTSKASKPKTQAEKKAKEREREQVQKEREDERKDKAKTRKQEQKEKKKAYNQRKKEREKELKARRKARKRGEKPVRRSTEVIGDDTPEEKTTTSKESKNTLEDAAKKAKEEAAQKAKEEKLKKEIEKDEKDRPFKHRSAHQEGQLWLARTYIERDKYDQASYLIQGLERNPNLYKDVASELEAVKAHYFIKRKQFDQAIPALEVAKETAKKRIDKARMAYILAQIYQQKGSTSSALSYFEEVVKLKPAYEMEFSARLSMTLSDYHSGGASVDKAIKSLEKMLKDEKNVDFKDRIYFAMAEIYLKDGQEKLGVEHLKKALKEGGGNNAQKAEALVKLAYLFYQEEDYVKAKNYFGEALSLLPKTDERYDDIEKLNNTLADVARNIEAVALQDSLLSISRMTNDEKRNIAYEIRKKQEEDRKKSIQNANNSKFGPRSRPSVGTGGVARATAGAAKSSFFAYDDKSVKRGKRSFDRAWGGDRVLEDNWRRSNRQNSTAFDEEDRENELASNRLGDEEVATILRGVPQSQKQIEGAENTLADAMFELGVLYRERLQNYKKSVETFERLLERFPNNSHKAESLYYLYLSHNDLGNSAKAQGYRDQLVKEFPESIFAQVLTDPNYLAKINAEEMRLTNYYNAVYANFTSDNYQVAYDSLQQVDTRFGATNPLQPRFALLAAMTLGKLEGKEAYVRSLKDVVAKYPNTAEQIRAREILRLLGTSVGSIPGGGDLSADERYKYEPEKLHYLVIALPPEAVLNDVKINVSDFNRKYHTNDKLRISNIYLDGLNGGDRTPLVVVRRFKTEEDVMNYYRGVEKNSRDFIQNIDYEMYPITQTNYREVLKSKSLEDYKAFFQANYLK